jgi:hypothetical protein
MGGIPSEMGTPRARSSVLVSEEDEKSGLGVPSLAPTIRTEVIHRFPSQG